VYINSQQKVKLKSNDNHSTTLRMMQLADYSTRERNDQLALKHYKRVFFRSREQKMQMWTAFECLESELHKICHWVNYHRFYGTITASHRKKADFDYI